MADRGGPDPLLPTPADLLRRFDDDADLLREVAATFLETCPVLMASGSAAVAAGDLVALERIAHTVKGSVGNFGAAIAVSAAQRVERLAAAGDSAAAAPAWRSLQAAVDGLAGFLTPIARPVDGPPGC